MSDAVRWLNQALAMLDLAALEGHDGARHAAAVLRGLRRSGRQSIDDADLLAEVRELVLAGRGREAVGIVARLHGKNPADVKCIERRLRRKRHSKISGQKDLSATEKG